MPSRFIGVECGAAFSRSAVISRGGYRVPRISRMRLYELESDS